MCLGFEPRAARLEVVDQNNGAIVAAPDNCISLNWQLLKHVPKWCEWVFAKEWKTHKTSAFRVIKIYCLFAKCSSLKVHTEHWYGILNVIHLSPNDFEYILQGNGRILFGCEPATSTQWRVIMLTFTWILNKMLCDNNAKNAYYIPALLITGPEITVSNVTQSTKIQNM